MFNRNAAVVLAACLFAAVPVSAASESIPEAVEVEAVSSASKSDYYGDYGIEGDELMEAVNSFSGSYVISTVNEDGTPLAAYFVYSMAKDGDEYYLVLGLAENQTRENLARTGEAMALYAANPEPDAQAQFAVSGARMRLELVTDEELVEKLNTSDDDTVMLCRVAEVRSLG